jgi:DnaJ-class molecular chaperone
MPTCSRCSGRKSIACPKCEGRGTVEDSQLELIAEVSRGTPPCPDCGGTGTIPCPDCEGSGVRVDDNDD